MTNPISDKLDAIIKHLDKKQAEREPRVKSEYDPNKVIQIMQTLAKGIGIDWKVTPSEIEAVNAIFNSGKGVLIKGDKGTGKTLLLKLISKAYEIIHNEPPYMISAIEFNLMYQKEGAAKILDHKTGAMFIDDIGAEPQAANNFGSRIDPISTLLFLRYEARMKTFCTTNLTIDELKERYGDRLADRFKQMFVVITFKGESKR